MGREEVDEEGGQQSEEKVVEDVMDLGNGEEKVKAEDTARRARRGNMKCITP